ARRRHTVAEHREATGGRVELERRLIHAPMLARGHGTRSCLAASLWHSRRVRVPADRIREFEDRFTRAQATEVVEYPWGYAVLQREFPLSHYHNRVAVTAPANAHDVLDAADRVLAGLAHRYVSVPDDAVGAELVPAFEAAGYRHEVIVTMAHSGAPAPPPA